MKKIIGTILIFITLILTAIPTLALIIRTVNNTILSNDIEFVSGEIIVKFKNDVDSKRISYINSRYGLSVISLNEIAGFHRLKVPQGKPVLEMVDILNRDPNVEYAEPDFIAYADMVPNDPYYNYQWHLHDINDGGINMQPAWDITTGLGQWLQLLILGSVWVQIYLVHLLFLDMIL